MNLNNLASVAKERLFLMTEFKDKSFRSILLKMIKMAIDHQSSYFIEIKHEKYFDLLGSVLFEIKSKK
jgi:hypothetical protein